MTTEYESSNENGAPIPHGSVRDRAEAARTKASDAYSAARERTGAAYESAMRKTSDGIDANPAIALIGGLALGALAAALLPKTRGEEEAFGKIGRRINDGARDAVRAAKEAGTNKLDELGYNRDTAKEKLQALRSDAAEVAGAAAQRAKTSAGQ